MYQYSQKELKILNEKKRKISLRLCPVCQNNLVLYFAKVFDPISLTPFSIYRCRHCGVRHTIPQPEDLSRFYKTHYYGNRHRFTSKFCTKRRLKFLFSATGEGTGKKLLDIGCGNGSFLLAARNAGWEVMGTEINPDPARKAGLDIMEDIKQLSGGDTFDCITMWHSLEHMRDIKVALLHVRKHLNPEGKLIIAIPDNDSPQARIFRHKWFHLDVPRHLYHFDANSLNFSLNLAGFSIVKQWHQELEYDLMGWVQSALNCLNRKPNVFYELLVGRRKHPFTWQNISNFLLGSLLAPLFLPLVAIETLLHRGGTLIVVTQKNSQKPCQ